MCLLGVSLIFNFVLSVVPRMICINTKLSVAGDNITWSVRYIQKPKRQSSESFRHEFLSMHSENAHFVPNMHHEKGTVWTAAVEEISIFHSLS